MDYKTASKHFDVPKKNSETLCRKIPTERDYSNASTEIISPSEIKPLPKMSIKTRRKHAGGSSLITTSPYKKKLEESLVEKSKSKLVKDKKIATVTKKLKGK